MASTSSGSSEPKELPESLARRIEVIRDGDDGVDGGTGYIGKESPESLDRLIDVTGVGNVNNTGDDRETGGEEDGVSEGGFMSIGGVGRKEYNAGTTRSIDGTASMIPLVGGVGATLITTFSNRRVPPSVTGAFLSGNCSLHKGHFANRLCPHFSQCACNFPCSVS
jgi:hypothetical protein